MKKIVLYFACSASVLFFAPVCMALTLSKSLPEKIIEGDTEEFVVTLLNDSDESIKINKIKPSCGCIVLLPGSQGDINLREKESVDLKLKISTQGKHGIITEDLLIEWSSKTKQDGLSNLHTKFEVVQNLFLEPNISKSDVSVVQNEPSHVKFEYRLEKSQGLVDLKTKKGQVQIVDTKNSKDGAVTVTLQFPAEVMGRFDDTISISDRKFSYNVPLNWVVHNSHFDKYALSLGLTKKGDNKTTDLQIQSNEPFEIMDIKSEISSRIVWKILKSDDSKKNISITFNAVEFPVGSLSSSAKIIIKTSKMSVISNLEIPIHALVY